MERRNPNPVHSPLQMTETQQLAKIAFGDATTDLKEAARKSDRLYVRGLDQLAEPRPGATGRRLTAIEALDAYGIDVLAEVAREGFARLAPNAEAAGRVLRQRREQLGLDTRFIARRSGLPEKVVLAAEASSRLPVRTYERIARVLGLDERYVSVRSEPMGNSRIAVRLRTIGDENPRLDPSAVSAISEAAWVAMTQIRLENALCTSTVKSDIEQSVNYGTPDFPAYEWGYLLAADTRQKLGLGTEPIESLRELAEERLGIPIIQADMGDQIAGVTVEVGDRRAIAVNTAGKNQHVYVRRATIAHELGHLLYDPRNKLNHLRVDEYVDLDKPAEQLRDPVEQRANAYAVSLLAPMEAAVQLFQRSPEDGLGNVMDHFGISATAARYQIWNGLRREKSLDEIRTSRRVPPDHWEGHEAFTATYHPLGDVRTSRAGRFSALAVRAAEEGLVSWDTAAEWLETSDDDLRQVAQTIRGLFPAVWP
jgi:Zn-dependent peptidase ImmA (M78 family)/transcriptional regulator with XRE-family HTH domain